MIDEKKKPTECWKKIYDCMSALVDGLLLLALWLAAALAFLSSARAASAEPRIVKDYKTEIWIG